MNYEEAKIKIKEILKREIDKRTDQKEEFPIGDIDDILQLNKIIQQALENKIPQKPKLTFIDWYGTGVEELGYLCPLCECELAQDEHHCICGQAIDWSDEE